MNKLTKKRNVSRTKSRKNVSKSMKNMRGGRKLTFENRIKIFTPKTGSSKKKNLIIVPTVKSQPSWVKQPTTVEVKPKPIPIPNKLNINPLFGPIKTISTRPDISTKINAIREQKLSAINTQQQMEALSKFVSRKSYVEPIGKIPEGLMTINKKTVPDNVHKNIVGIVQRQLQKYPELNYNTLYRKIYSTRTSYNPFKELTAKNESKTPETKKISMESIYSKLANIKRENPYEDSR